MDDEGKVCQDDFATLFVVQPPYDASCPSVGELVGLWVCLSKFPKRVGSYTSMLLSKHLIKTILGQNQKSLF